MIMSSQEQEELEIYSAATDSRRSTLVGSGNVHKDKKGSFIPMANNSKRLVSPPKPSAGTPKTLNGSPRAMSKCDDVNSTQEPGHRVLYHARTDSISKLPDEVRLEAMGYGRNHLDEEALHLKQQRMLREQYKAKSPPAPVRLTIKGSCEITTIRKEEPSTSREALAMGKESKSTDLRSASSEDDDGIDRSIDDDMIDRRTRTTVDKVKSFDIELDYGKLPNDKTHEASPDHQQNKRISPKRESMSYNASADSIMRYSISEKDEDTLLAKPKTKPRPPPLKKKTAEEEFLHRMSEKTKIYCATTDSWSVVDKSTIKKFMQPFENPLEIDEEVGVQAV